MGLTLSRNRSASAMGEPVPESELDALRGKIDGAFKSFASVISAARRPLPDQTGSGKYLNDEPPDALDHIQGGLADLATLDIKDVATLLEVQRKKLSGEPIDDKTYLMEAIINVSVQLKAIVRGYVPLTFSRSRQICQMDRRPPITNNLVTQLWQDLQHPPQS
jgi:linoleate 8R-lipoxygenase / 9,12-octadecadienoate 8-hydroperoxide 8R-isomerase